MYIKKRKDDKDKKGIKDILDKIAGVDTEGRPLKYPDEDTIIAKIVDYEETVEILKEVLITPDFKVWWDKNSIEGITIDHDTKIVVIPTKIEIELNYSVLKRLGIFAEEFGYTVTSEHLENL
jgi:hypothetical protein